MWTLINNGSHKCYTFTSQEKLKMFAKKRKWGIKKSPTCERTYYTESFSYIPA